MFANITIDFLLTMGTDVTNVPLFTTVTMVTRVTSAHWVRLLEGAKGFISENILCSVLLLDWGDRLLTAACNTPNVVELAVGRPTPQCLRASQFSEIATFQPMLRNSRRNSADSL
jgi:hypothetical protein